MHEGQVDNICCCCSCVFVAVAVMRCQYEMKKGLVDNICCCCSRVVVVVVVVTRRDMKLLCACAQGFVVDIDHHCCHCNCCPCEGYELPLPLRVCQYEIGAFALRDNGESSAQACAQGVVVILDCCLSIIWWLTIWKTLAPAHEGCCWHVDVSSVLFLVLPLRDTIFWK